MKAYKTVDDYISNSKLWQAELIQLRDILLETDLTEEVKWGGPIYTYEGKNVAAIAGFKSYFGLWFHQGALLKDPKKKLINAQEGITKALRQWRFSSANEIDAKIIKAYVRESIQNLKSGKTIKPAPKKTIVSKELVGALKKNVTAAKQFKLLAPYKQRDYIEYISQAAKPETKIKRINKVIPMITKGIGLNDKYS